MPLTEHVYCVAVTFKMTEQGEQWICITVCIKLEHSSKETIQMIQKATAVSNRWWAASSWQCTPTHASHLMQSFLAKRQITQVTQPHYSPDLAACNFCFFPKIKSPLKGKRFHIINKIQENTTGQLMAIRRTVWGPKVPTLKGTEASLSYVQCFLCLYLLQKCLYFFILHGWRPSGQTSYIFFTLLFSFSLCKYPEVGFLDYTEVLFLIFWGSSIVFSINAVNLHSQQ